MSRNLLLVQAWLSCHRGIRLAIGLSNQELSGWSLGNLAAQHSDAFHSFFNETIPFSLTLLLYTPLHWGMIFVLGKFGNRTCFKAIHLPVG
jgi:hypothetical protein